MVPVEEKTTSEWLDIIQQAADEGMLECTFTGGDPFMREDFEEIYCRAYDMGLRTAIMTNAALIGEQQRRYLSKRKPDFLSVTLYGASSNSYEKICGNGAAFERVIASLDGLQAAGLNFEIKTLGLNPLLSEMESIGSIAKRYNCPQKIDVYIAPGRDDTGREKEWRISTEKFSSAIDSYFGFLKKPEESCSEKTNIDRSKRSKRAINCRAGTTDFVITHDGRLLGCPQLTCFKAYPFNTGFKEAWKLLSGMIENAEACEECESCPDYNGCYRCPAIRLKETGSVALCSQYLHEFACALAKKYGSAV
jgi:MoaA/NifB/PqqE/SkfB family radical SAM enzyme